MACSRYPAVSALLVVLMGAIPPAAAQTSASRASANPCSNSPEDYKGWGVTGLNVASPLGFFAAANFGFNRLSETLLLQHEAGFDPQQFQDGVAWVNNAVKAQLPAGFTSLKLVVTVNRLKNCDPIAKTLEVDYVVYTAIVPSLSGKSFEQRQASVERPAISGATTSSAGRLLAIPYIAYDHTLHGSGGGLIQSQAPLGIFDSIKMDASSSSNSLLGELGLSAQRTPTKRYLNQVEWQLTSAYRDIPTGTQSLKEGKLAASLFGSSRELTAAGLILNYGASLGGGHQQSTVPGASNSSYGDLKFLAGAQGRWGPTALAGAYGIQLGSTLAGRSVDFAKHIVDLGYSTVFAPMPEYLKHDAAGEACNGKCDDRTKYIGAAHKPLSLEARATGGFIQRFGAVPAVERFFGGNQQKDPFINGEPWDIRGQPYIRSIPAYQLGSSNPAFGLGGTRFYCLNLTVGKAVAGRAILPKELGSEEFVQVLTGAMKSASGLLSDTYFGKDPAVKKATDDVTLIGQEVDKLKAALPPPNSFDSATNKHIAPLLTAATFQAKLVSAIVVSITVKGNRNSTVQLINTLVPKLETDLTVLRDALTAARQAALAKTLGDRQDAIDGALQQLKTAWNGTIPGSNQTEIQAAHARADAQAGHDLSPAWSVLNTVLYQLNIYSVAPVGIFDVARVWPSGVGARYAVGGGVRLSVVNANFTLGYAFNPQRGPGEGIGALFVKLDISDIFH